MTSAATTCPCSNNPAASVSAVRHCSFSKGSSGAPGRLTKSAPPPDRVGVSAKNLKRLVGTRLLRNNDVHIRRPSMRPGESGTNASPQEEIQVAGREWLRSRPSGTRLRGASIPLGEVQQPSDQLLVAQRAARSLVRTARQKRTPYQGIPLYPRRGTSRSRLAAETSPAALDGRPRRPPHSSHPEWASRCCPCRRRHRPRSR